MKTLREQIRAAETAAIQRRDTAAASPPCDGAEPAEKTSCCGTSWKCPVDGQFRTSKYCATVCGNGQNPPENAKPLTVTLMINTLNEGADVAQTIKSFREHCSCPMEVIVVADGTTDGSCDALGEDVTVIRKTESVGCGKAKAEATALAKGDVFVYSDGHMRVLKGDIAKMAELARQQQAVVCPGLAPMHCAPDEQPGPEHGTKNTSWGARMWVSGAGFKVELNGAANPDEELQPREAASWACWAISRDVLENRLCGWNEYPGRWGSQELGLTLRAWFADVPIVVHRDTIVLHRYKTGKHVPKETLYKVPRWHTRVNSWYAPTVVFGSEALAETWGPILNRTTRLREEGAEGLEGSAVLAQGDVFRSIGKVRKDEEFFQAWCIDGIPPSPMIPRKDITTVLLNYRRPKMVQQCVDALRKCGLRNIWCWNQEGAKPPRGISKWINSQENDRTWPRYAIAGMVKTPYVMFIDDDCNLTEWGLSALREYATRFPDRILGLIGCVFNWPFDSYQRRHFYKSHKIYTPMPVDFVWPKGLLGPCSVFQRIYGVDELWQQMKAQLGETSGDDLIMGVALQKLGLPPALIVPSIKAGYKEPKDENRKAALSTQPGRLKKKRAMVPVFREQGWKPIRMAEWEKRDTEFDRRWAWLMENRVKIQQTRGEIEWAFNEVESRRPRTFVEIGAMQGSSLYLYAHGCAPGAKIIAIEPIRARKDLPNLEKVVAQLKADGYDAHLIIGKSHEDRVMAEVDKLLGGPLDFLHIDGDHKYASVSRDFELYMPRLAQGGLILLHDIVHTRHKSGVPRLWREIKEHLPTAERIMPGTPKGSLQGIGLIFF